MLQERCQVAPGLGRNGIRGRLVCIIGEIELHEIRCVRRGIHKPPQILWNIVPNFFMRKTWACPTEPKLFGWRRFRQHVRREVWDDSTLIALLHGVANAHGSSAGSSSSNMIGSWSAFGRGPALRDDRHEASPPTPGTTDKKVLRTTTRWQRSIAASRDETYCGHSVLEPRRT